MASIPERAGSLELAVSSLAPQVDWLQLSLNGYDRAPSFLRDHPNVRATLRDAAGGDAEKFAAVDEWDGYVVTADDDLLYPPGYVEALVEGVERYERRALVGFHGGTTLGWNGSAKAASHKSIRCLGALDEDDDDVNVLGTGTLAYHAGSVPLWRDVFRSANMADVHLACHARTFGIPMVALAHEEGWLLNIGPEDGPRIYDSNARRDGSSLDTTERRRAELERFDWTQPPGLGPRVRVSIATCDRPHLLHALLEDLEREARWVDLEVHVYEDPSDADYWDTRKLAERNGWDWTRFDRRLGRDNHRVLVDEELVDCQSSGASWFMFLPDDVRLVRHAVPRAIDTWSRLDEPATLTLWRLKDHEGLTNWTGQVPVERGEAWECFHVDGIYLARRDTLDLLDYRVPPARPNGRRATSSGVGRAMSLALHRAGQRMYRVGRSLAVPVVTPSVMNPETSDRAYPWIAL